jgi:poly-gamma-glutamate capsule biosynthesis protein CapA/YwtB (metallophosphatase superfamily)
VEAGMEKVGRSEMKARAKYRQIVLLACSGLLFGSSFAQSGSTTLPDNFTFAAVGDMIYLRPALKTLQETAPSVLQALASGDITFGNFETNGFDLEGFSGYRQYSPIIGVSLLASPAAMGEIQAMGFNLVSFANNHTFDWGIEGVRATGDALRRAKITYAGVGDSLTDARSAKGLQLGDSSVALIAATTAYPAPAVAADRQGPVRARPGLSALPLKEVVYANREKFASLQALSGRHTDNVDFMGRRYRLDSNQAVAFVTRYQMDEDAVSEILYAIKASANENALTVFSLHTHEAEGDPSEPPQFERDLAHAVIDAGADLFIAHGPHQLRGIEIYKGKPIFYSLANFAIMMPPSELNPVSMEIEPGSIFTQASFLESVVATNHYKDGKLAEIHLHPFKLTQTNEPDTHAIPQDVSDEVARSIIARMKSMSERFGTKLADSKGIGIITIE